jgi:putative alpha-1,2-mannosidase
MILKSIGMAKAVADTDSGSNQGGFTTDGSSITGFSSMHDSGTGGSPSLGNFPLFPYTSCAGDDVNGCKFPKRSRKTQFVSTSVKASPGYFGLKLATGIEVDMTTLSTLRYSASNFQPPMPLAMLRDRWFSWILPIFRILDRTMLPSLWMQDQEE